MRPAEQQQEPHPSRGMGRMVIASAVLHVAVIVLLFMVTSRNRSESSPRLTSQTVELVSPGVLRAAGRGGGGVRPDRKEPPPAEQPTESPREKAGVKEAPPKPPQERKEEEQSKPKEPPPPEAQETPKVVAAKPRPQEPPAAKPKPVEPVKPKETVKLPEKRTKAETKPPPKPVEKEKPQVKNPPPEKSQPEKKPVEAAQKSERPVSAKRKLENVPPPGRQEKTKEHEDRELKGREERVLAALEKIRANEEAAEREKEIVAALERVRRRTAGKDTGGVTNREAPAPAGHEREGGTLGVAAGNGSQGYGTEFIAYTQYIKQRVKDAWILAERKPGLRAVVRFGVEESGRVTDVELADSSGDRTFDQSALRAVSKASPFPSPPEAYREEFATQKVEITFSGEEEIR